MNDILINTPLYIYWMFFSLLIIGLMQRKTRNVTKNRALLIPLILASFSLYGLVVDFGINELSMYSFLSGFTLSSMMIIYLNKRISIFDKILYNDKKKFFIIEGSPIPLFLFMLVFFIKYMLGYFKITKPELFENMNFIILFCYFYGMFLAIFFMRFYILWKKSRLKYIYKQNLKS